MAKARVGIPMFYGLNHCLNCFCPISKYHFLSSLVNVSMDLYTSMQYTLTCVTSNFATECLPELGTFIRLLWHR